MITSHQNSCPTHRGTQSFSTHAWMLKTFLQQTRSHLEKLQLYVVAADFKKMLKRMNHSVSKHYLARLQQVKSMTFVPIKVMPYDKNDILFLESIPILATELSIPHLEKVARAAEKEEPFTLYNKDTCMEFHQILCELLKRFHDSLKALLAAQKENAKIRRIMDELDRVLALGKALRAIVRGRAIEVHLATIAPFLEVKAGTFMTHDSEDSEDLEDDAEFHLLQQYTTDANNREPLLPSKSFHDWLRLMVHHFDAIHVLDNYLVKNSSPSEPPIEISIKIIFPSSTDNNHDMLPWKELLKNQTYFPPIPFTPKQPSPDEIITFLTSPTLGEDDNAIQLLINDVNQKKLATNFTVTNFTAILNILKSGLNDLIKTLSAGWKDYVQDILLEVDDILLEVEDLKDILPDTTHTLLSLLEGFLNKLENLQGSLKLYYNVKPNTSLSLGKGFKGGAHCELIAAVSNSLSGTGPHNGLSEDTLKEFEVSHISVPCSNLCQTL